MRKTIGTLILAVVSFSLGIGLYVVLAVASPEPTFKECTLVIGDSWADQVPVEYFYGPVYKCAFPCSTRNQMTTIARYWSELDCTEIDKIVVLWGIAEHVGRGSSIEDANADLEELRTTIAIYFQMEPEVIAIEDMARALSVPEYQIDEYHLNDVGWDAFAKQMGWRRGL